MMLERIVFRHTYLFFVFLFMVYAVYGGDRGVCGRCGHDDCEYMVGINLAGAEFAPHDLPGIEGRHYGWPKTEELDYWQSKGIQLVRFPFLWERLQPKLGESFNREYLAGLERSVKMMGQRNMHVILDVHNYAKYRGQLIGSDSVPVDAFGDLWARLAMIFKDNPAVYGYGLMNEPGPCDWAKAAQVAIDAIRQVDTDTRIYVANDYAGWAVTYIKEDLVTWAEKSLRIGDPKMLHDPSNRLRWELHMYMDHDASGTYRKSYQLEIERTDGPGSRVGPEIGVDRTRPLVEWLKKYNEKGIIGEYSAPANPGVDRRWLYALKKAQDFFQENCLANTYWAAGERFTKGQGYVISDNGWSRKSGKTGDRPQLKMLRKYIASSKNERKQVGQKD